MIQWLSRKIKDVALILCRQKIDISCSKVMTYS